MGSKQKNLNYYTAYKIDSKKRIDRSILFGLLFLILIILFFLLLYFYLEYQSVQLKNDLDTINAYINDENNKSYNEAIIAENKLTIELIPQSNYLKSIKGFLLSSSLLNAEDFTTFMNCCGSDITINKLSYSQNERTLSLDATTTSTSAIAYYIQRLKNCGLFYDIDYRGFKQNTSKELYSFTLTCIFNTGDANE